MRNAGIIVIFAVVMFLFAACSPAEPNPASLQTDPKTNSERASEEESYTPVFLHEIGKTYAMLKSENPLAAILDVNFPNAAAICLSDPASDYAYYLFGTQYLLFDTIDDDIKEQLRCAGFATTVSVLFPQAEDAATFSEFFSAIGVSDYFYATGEEAITGLGWLSFRYHDLEVYLDTTSDSMSADGEFSPAQTIKECYNVFIIDVMTERQNLTIIEESEGYHRPASG